MDDPVLLTSMIAAALALAGLALKRALAMRLLLLAAGLAAALAAWRAGSVVLALIVLAGVAANLFRIFGMQNTSRRIRHIRHYGYDVSDLARYMKPQRFTAGETIFERGDPADRLYLVTSGTVGIENGARVEKNGLLGEVGLFSKAGKRSMGATALSDVELRTLSGEEVSKLCLNEPEFAYALSQIMAARMTENMARVTGAT
ncbi:MAG: cyclic nucleotide-binding domain-containing protein [Nitratireductor sp.]|nr:cyclic nucleotide-binding domain-containing protein [Nitratireductor sp.]